MRATHKIRKMGDEMSEPRQLTAEELDENIRHIYCVPIQTRLRNHIAWQDGKIARLEADLAAADEDICRIQGESNMRMNQVLQLSKDLEAAGEQENALREALVKIRTGRHENDSTPYPCDDQAWWIADAALDTPPSVYAQRAQKMAAVVEAARNVVRSAEGMERIEVHWHIVVLLGEALAALDDVEQRDE